MTGFDHTRCSECSERHRCCPDCGGTHVSVDTLTDATDVIGAGSLSPNFRRFAVGSDPSRSLAYRLVCWDCGWAVDRELTVTEPDADDGGDADA